MPLAFSLETDSHQHTYGPTLRKLGTHPRKIQAGPSTLNAFLAAATMPVASVDVEDMTLVFKTSRGFVTVTAITAARNAEVACTVGVSSVFLARYSALTAFAVNLRISNAFTASSINCGVRYSSP